MQTEESQLLDASCRVAFAAFLHDLGKLAQRARAFDKDPRRDAHVTLYCPFNQKGGFHTHLHAADTALALDLLEPHLPALLAGDPAPFQPRGSTTVTDSLINAAAAHHKPDTFLQWVVATADRVASGFERSKFEEYNAAEDHENFREARMLVRFEDYRGPGAPLRAASAPDCQWRYPLALLSPEALMPAARDAPHARGEDAYGRLWQALLGDGDSGAQDGPRGVGRIPKSHRSQWPLWLDHFDTLWLTVAQAIPSATAFGVRPDVSLYDHSRTTAALAVALWRYHRDGDTAAAAQAMARRADWDTEKFLLIEGDFSGIQSFIFGGEGMTQKRAARLLRGRSALVGLLSELAALALLEALALPATSQVINAAGHFQIVAANTAATRAAIARVQAQLDRWFLDHMFGLGGIVLAATPAACADFTDGARFRNTTAKLWRNLDVAKRRMFGLVSADAPEAVRRVDFSAGPCPFDGRLPASADVLVDGAPAHPLNKAAIELGGGLASERQRLLVFRADGAPAHGLLTGDYFGYRVMLTDDREASGNFGAFATDGRLRRAWDISLPDKDPAAVAWQGYGRRPLAAWVPRHTDAPEANRRFDGLEPAERGQLQSFGHLARADQQFLADGKVMGVEALGVLKGDIDDLGAFFEAQGQKPSFAARAEMSRRISSFFTVWVPSLLARGANYQCAAATAASGQVPSLLAREANYQSIYTVFAGGDDFFFVGPWRSLRCFAKRLRDDFARYVAGNAALHFSAGYVMAKPGHPVRALADDAEHLLEQAKSGGKNAFALFANVVPWPEWGGVEQAMAALDKHIDADKLPTTYLYGLLGLADMAADAGRKPENARWRSRLFYQTRRHFERSRDVAKEDREARALALIEAVGVEGLQRNPQGFRIALFDQLYARRD